MSLGAGEVFAGYTVVRLLGSGGMGEVYLAKHPRLPRQDAIKVLPAALSADTDFRARFEREADLAATLWHPHIVGVHDRGEDNGRLWIAMDYVEGHDAAHDLRENYPNGMPTDDVLDIITAIADALDYAHERHLLHRDVKPANILLTDAPRRRILLTDFGIARRSDDSAGLTATNMTIGSVAYTAPEQLMGEHLDGRADQYSLAATAYHLLTGAPPFTHTNPTVVISRHLNTPAPTLNDTRPDLAAYSTPIAKALAKNPHDRYDNCQHFATALRHTLTTPDTSPPVVLSKPASTATPEPGSAEFASEPTMYAAAPPTYAAESTTFVPRPTTGDEATGNEAAPPVFVSSWGDLPPPPPAQAAAPPTVVGGGPPVPPSGPPPYLQQQPAPQQGTSNAALGWILAGLAALVVVVIAVIVSTSGSTTTTTTPYANPGSPYPSGSGGTTGGTTTYTTTTTTAPAPRQRVAPPAVSSLDANDQSCAGGITPPGAQGWASTGVRGSDATTCYFTGQVATAYWSDGPPVDGLREVIAQGAVPCGGSSRCSGSNFVMSCQVEGSDPWITCRGGRNAIVILF